LAGSNASAGLPIIREVAKREVPPLLAKLGALVCRLRNDHGWTQSQLAEKAEVSTKRLGELERGVPNARIMTAVKVAEALGIPPYSLFAPENLIPPGADPALVRHFELAREAFEQLGLSMGMSPPSPGASSTTFAERYPRPRRTRSKSKKP
jgi:transcriptional regulator with XRE-family HTH domain